MSDASPHVRVSIDQGVARLTLAAPDSGNALSLPLIDSLAAALDRVLTDGSCRAIVLGADGEVFCQGLQLDAEPEPARAIAAAERFGECLLRIVRSPVPVIVSVRGPATGGGVGLVAAGDIVIAHETAGFTLPEVVVGLIPAVIAPFLLRRVPVSTLQSLALSTRTMAASDAHARGLVDEVTSDVGAAIDRQLARVLRSSPHAMATTKRYLGALDDGLESRVAVALDHFRAWIGQPDQIDGLRQFTAGFAPPWFARYRRPSTDG